MPVPYQHIGTTNESDLHRELKRRYAGFGGETEVEIDGFICDGRGADDTIIEIQLGSFAPLRRKAQALCAGRRLLVIHPVVLKKTIVTHNADGSALRRRASPRKGSEWDVFYALVYAPRLPLTANLAVELALIDVLETRVCDGKGSWRRGGISIAGRSLQAYHGAVRLAAPRDYLRFAPFAAGERWTAGALAAKARICTNLAYKTIFVLEQLGLIRKSGKMGRANAWELSG